VKDLIEAICQQKVADGSGTAFVHAVLCETEGNPFFIEEVLRHLDESGGLYRRDGRWVTDPKSIAEMGVPQDARTVIGRRLGRLSETTNRALAAAAVLGREFEFALLASMSGLPEDDVVQAVEGALANQMVVEMRGPMGPRYAFTHALVRQTLYEELSLPRRQRLHLKAARAIESLYQRNLEPHVAALANHYRMAGAAAEAEKTIEYSIRAGRAAYAVFAYEEAGAHWRAALELMDEHGGGDPKRRAKLLRRLGDELVSSCAKAVEYLEAAAPLFEELSDHQAACDVHLRLALYLSVGNSGAMDVRRAMPHFKKAETFLANQPESLRHAVFYLRMTAASGWTLRISDGLAAGKRAMEISERLDQPSLRDGYWSTAAALSSHLLIFSGSVTEALCLADQARGRAGPIDDTMIGSTVAWIGGDNYHFLGNPRQAQEWYTCELAKPRTARSAIRGALLHHHLADACIEMGELTKARIFQAEANAQNKPEGLPLFVDEARLLFLEGQWELADKMLTAQAERARTSGNRREDLWSAGALARLRRLTGERAQALQFLQKALDISVEAGAILAELKTRCALATMVADAGDTGEALPHLERCRQIVGAGEDWFGLAGLVERAGAVVAAAQGKYAPAEDQFKKAIATFQHYCLRWEEADTLQYWGRALFAAGERTRAIEKFDAAIKIYHSHGAGQRFIEYVMADKRRAQDSKSTTPQ
jgi:tetratricopeptide (TPR) repeat protein